MNENAIRENYNSAINQGYSHMFVLKDVFSNEERYFFVREGNDVDAEVESFTCVDTLKLIGIFNYKTPLDKQIAELKSFEKAKEAYLLKLSK